MPEFEVNDFLVPSFRRADESGDSEANEPVPAVQASGKISDVLGGLRFGPGEKLCPFFLRVGHGITFAHLFGANLTQRCSFE